MPWKSSVGFFWNTEKKHAFTIFAFQPILLCLQHISGNGLRALALFPLLLIYVKQICLSGFTSDNTDLVFSFPYSFPALYNFNFIIIYFFWFFFFFFGYFELQPLNAVLHCLDKDDWN